MIPWSRWTEKIGEPGLAREDFVLPSGPKGQKSKHYSSNLTDDTGEAKAPLCLQGTSRNNRYIGSHEDLLRDLVKRQIAGQDRDGWIIRKLFAHV